MDLIMNQMNNLRDVYEAREGLLPPDDQTRQGTLNMQDDKKEGQRPLQPGWGGVIARLPLRIKGGFELSQACLLRDNPAQRPAASR